MRKNWHITQRPVTLTLPAYNDQPPIKMDMHRCVLVSSKDTEHLNPTPDLDEMFEWCHRNIGDPRDFDGKPVWVYSPSSLYFTFAKEEHALAFYLTFRTA